MAVSRVGGTKGLLSGQVGKTIYQIKNNGDGTYTQIAYNKGERTETTFSPKLQAQRMCMGMVESLMKQLKPLIGISFQSGRNKTTSCNAFSSANLRLVQRDCQEHWYADNKFVFPYQYKGYPDFSELGGPYMISSGSLKDNLYDELIFDGYAPAQWRDLPYADSALWGLKFSVRIGVDTLEQFRQRHGMTIMDKICFAGFKTWISYEPDPEDPKTLSKHDYFIASFNKSFPSNVILTPDVLVDLFQFKTNAAPAVYISRDNDAICVGCCLDSLHADESYYYWTGFSESHLTGKRQISTSFYGNDLPDDDPYLLDRQPSMVFGSWMGQPQVKPYPSPFAPPPVPPAPPRLPAEYQEVEWIQRDSGPRTVFSYLYKPRYASLRFRAAGQMVNGRYILYNNTGLWRPLISCYRGNKEYGLVFSIAGAGSTAQSDTIYLNSFTFDGVFEFKRSDNVFICSYNDESVNISFDDSGEDDPAKIMSFWYPDNSSMVYRVYEVICHDVRDNSMMFDLVPCYRKTDGFCGFYNLITSKFTTGQTADGQYSHGNPINP